MKSRDWNEELWAETRRYRQHIENLKLHWWTRCRGYYPMGLKVS